MFWVMSVAYTANNEVRLIPALPSNMMAVGVVSGIQYVVLHLVANMASTCPRFASDNAPRESNMKHRIGRWSLDDMPASRLQLPQL